MTPEQIKAAHKLATRLPDGLPLRRALMDLLVEVEQQHTEITKQRAEIDSLRADFPDLGLWLTPIERAIVLGLANGQTAVRTGRDLGLSPTQSTYRLGQIHRRWGVETSTRVVTLALAAGLILPAQITIPGGDD